jgi:hypothetical protein
MVCYARPALRMGAIVLVLLAIFGRSGTHLLSGHFLGTAGLIAAITVAAGGAAVAAALGWAAIGSIRRRRAVAGGCVHCQFRCQRAMTEQAPGRPAVRAAAPTAAPPRWPDQPGYRPGVPSPRTAPAEHSVRAGAPQPEAARAGRPART